MALASLTFALMASGPLSGFSRAQEAQLQSAQDRLAQLKDELVPTIDRYNELNDQLHSVQAQMSVTEQYVEQVAKRMVGLEDRAVEMAQQLYKNGSSGALETLMSARSIAELENQLRYLEASGRHGMDVFGTLASDRRDLESHLDDLDAQRSALQSAVTEMEDLRAAIAGKIATQRDDIAALGDEITQEAQAVVSSPSPSSVVTPSVPPAGSEADWDAIAACESGGNWHLDSYYDGGLQFAPSTWLAYGGGNYARYAWQASREQQIAIAEKVLKAQGPGAWPNCFRWK